MSNGESIDDVAASMKDMYESAIVNGRRDGVHSLIRSQKLIGCIHEHIKNELVRHGVDPEKIYPRPGSSKPELKMAGFLKKKNQDISILPNPPYKEVIEEGALIGENDMIGKDLMNKSMSINIRSQLSSLAKNFDTLYERTFAEALNLHQRAPGLIMGEVYMVPFSAYDPDKAAAGKIGWREMLPFHYIPSFQEINNRSSADGEMHKYERVCLLVIDFKQNPPKIVESVKPFIDKGLISAEKAKKVSFSSLTIRDFVKDILQIYESRHGSLNALMPSYSQKQLDI